MLTLNSSIGTNYRTDPTDLVNTKQALNQLGYYAVPPQRGIDDWADGALFDGIKRFQKDNGLKVDAFMRPGGPTEQRLNTKLASGEGSKPGAPQDSSKQRRIEFLEGEIAKRREQVRQMRAAGADPNAVRGIEAGISQSERELSKLKGGGGRWGPFSW